MYLIDTNILIYHTNNDIPSKSKKMIRKIFKEYFNISVISRIEFLGYSGYSEKTYTKTLEFLDNAKIFSLSDEIVDSAIQIRRKKKIKIADAIIAATALQNNLIIVTRNVDDFKGIELEIYNPFTMSL